MRAAPLTGDSKLYFMGSSSHSCTVELMDELEQRRRGIDSRNRAYRRIRLVTVGTATAATAAAGAIAAVTATSGSTTKTVVRHLLAAGTTTTRVTVPAVAEPAATVTVQGGGSTAATASASPSAPTSAPTSAASTPVAVSGGS